MQFEISSVCCVCCRTHTSITLLCALRQVLPKGASKGDGLRRLLEMMDIDPQNVMMMGDGEEGCCWTLKKAP